ncbi:MAG: D-alanyl-D-alanine carboxypeptidase family protein [Bacilli bacterium]
MKKIIIFLILLFPISVKSISASSAVAMDLNSNRIFFEQNKDNSRLIASISKIMTTIVTIENCDINKTVTVGDEVLKSFGSAIYIEIGEQLTIKDLLYGLMLRSGNDAAEVIAKNVAGDMDSFAKLMNELAKKIGMTNTVFINAHGLENNLGKGNISSSYDMALLTKYAFKNETFKEIFGTKTKTIKSSYKTYSWTTKNKLLRTTDYITGGKTGYTEKAKRTLVTTASKNNVDVVVVTLNDSNDFSDHLDLYESIFKKYTGFLVLDKDNFKIDEDTFYKNNKLYIKNNFYLAIINDEKKSINIKYVLEKNKFPKNNTVVGNAEVYLKDKLMHSEKIYVKVDKKNKLSLWKKIIGWFKKW